MERTFRLTKRHRNLGVVCLIFFVLVGVASAYGTWAEAPEERRTSALYAATMFGVFWGSFACLACWLLLAYWREELRISDGQVTQQGVTGSKQIDLHSVTAFRWRIAPRPGGSLVLRTLTEKMTIYLGNFEPMERLWLIRFFSATGYRRPCKRTGIRFAARLHYRSESEMYWSKAIQAPTA